MARSSTEAEIVGLADGLNHALWSRLFLDDIGNGMKKMTIFQDNESTIHLMKNGRNNGQRTKHLNVRMFHAMECIEREEIELVYASTKDMIVDFLQSRWLDQCSRN
jgi:hypothetical protein